MGILANGWTKNAALNAGTGMQYPVNRPCPMCDSESRRVLASLRAEEFTIRNNETYRPDCFDLLGISPDDTYPLATCSQCGFYYAAHLPSNTFLQTVYERAIDHGKTITETIPYRREVLEKLAVVLGELDEKPRKLLDFGCGYGHALRILNMRDLKCLGFDVSTERLVRAGLSATSDVEELRRGGPFDVILCFDVLEHVPYPKKTLELLAGVSSEDSLLAINVPDLCSALSPEAIQSAFERGSLQRAINPWEHLNYFSASNLHAALEAHGFIPYGNLGRPQNLGFLPGAKGWRRVRNAIGVALRALRYKDDLGTSVLCRRDHARGSV
jgi:SAM-dependent methyltransferase